MLNSPELNSWGLLDARAVIQLLLQNSSDTDVVFYANLIFKEEGCPIPVHVRNILHIPHRLIYRCFLSYSELNAVLDFLRKEKASYFDFRHSAPPVISLRTNNWEHLY